MIRLARLCLAAALGVLAGSAAAQPGPPPLQAPPHCRAALPRVAPGAPAPPPGLAGRCAVLPPGCGSIAYTPQIGPPPNCSCACRPRMPEAPAVPGAPAPKL